MNLKGRNFLTLKDFTPEEIQYLLIHGLLHLLGHDHGEPAEKAVMFGLNDTIIAEWRRSRAGQ